MEKLGRLEKVDLRIEWPGEASHFTPWLARSDNLHLLGEALELELELEAQEKSVGPFKADLLCKDITTDSWVLIENQLEKTDHTHLGQVLTYAAGLKAVTIVWIAAKFTAEHRATLDWLNTITDETFRFFGIEVELWRIGDSLSAPKFNIISQPNDWSKAVRRAARSIDDQGLSDLRLLQLRYWELLHKELDNQRGPVSGDRKAQAQSWMTYSLGKSGITCATVVSRPTKRVRAEIYLSSSLAIDHFEQLHEKRDQIESALGYALEWPEMDGKRDRRILVALPINDFEDQTDWARQHAWLAQRVNELHRIFAPLVRELH